MGGSHSKRRSSRHRSSSSRSNPLFPQYQSPYLPQTQDHGAMGYNYGAPPPPQNYGGGGGHASQQSNRSDKKYTRIDDNYNSLEQVTEALASAGLESSNLIVGIDFTKSNEWTGARSFQRRCLHHIGHEQNPYEQAISIIGKTLPSFDEDNLIPVLDSEMRQHMTKKFLVSMMMRDFVMDSKKC